MIATTADPSADAPTDERSVLVARLEFHRRCAAGEIVLTECGGAIDPRLHEVRAAVVAAQLAEFDVAPRRAPAREPGETAVAELDLPLRTVNGLECEGVLFASELAGWSRGQLLSLPNFGVRLVGQIELALAKLGLSLRDAAEELPEPPRGPQVEKLPRRCDSQRPQRVAAAYREALLALADGVRGREVRSRVKGAGKWHAEEVKRRCRRRKAKGCSAEEIAASFGFAPGERDFLRVVAWVGALGPARSSGVASQAKIAVRN